MKTRETVSLRRGRQKLFILLITKHETINLWKARPLMSHNVCCRRKIDDGRVAAEFVIWVVKDE